MNEDNRFERAIYTADSKFNLQLREEQFKIQKKQMKISEVTVHKEILTEEKTITVPIIREELVIQKKPLDPEFQGKISNCIDTIRIPISEERIDISKHKTFLEDVKIYKHQFHETKSIEMKLKKEKLHLKTTGNPRVIYKQSKNPS
ncbi:YsnF/AvaK domain-containing protein [Clostridium bovifaecis]|uniref:YsnF/AvaK domain-containing protein n=1 Tax=Clostridium bovifaecis TaxID=2184719 RepID=A0A6I6ELB6_9CLOT|nr:YsnF/AvaK domain-containing protein [Clostridium bovifaecis]